MQPILHEFLSRLKDSGVVKHTVGWRSGTTRFRTRLQVANILEIIGPSKPGLNTKLVHQKVDLLSPIPVGVVNPECSVALRPVNIYWKV